MSERRLSSLEKIGYIRKLPKDANLNDYESITIKSKDGKKITLYRNLDKKKEIDDTSNFSSSWDVFNSYLN
tara:strand:+ start:5371 stop:5583 length:213 start_codon:yes stop_codon:yes gene_type:complete